MANKLEGRCCPFPITSLPRLLLLSKVLKPSTSLLLTISHANFKLTSSPSSAALHDLSKKNSGMKENYITDHKKYHSYKGNQRMSHIFSIAQCMQIIIQNNYPTNYLPYLPRKCTVFRDHTILEEAPRIKKRLLNRCQSSHVCK